MKSKNTAIYLTAIIILGLSIFASVSFYGSRAKKDGSVLGLETEKFSSESTATEPSTVIAESLPQETTTTSPAVNESASLTETTADKEDAAVAPSLPPVRIVPQATTKAPAAESENAPREILTPEGLDIMVLREGRGTRQVQEGDTVKIEYVERILSDRRSIDPTGSKGEPYIFQIGSINVIEGWNLGLIGMKEGELREIIIPSSLAYGLKGNAQLDVPADAILSFRVKLLKMN